MSDNKLFNLQFRNAFADYFYLRNRLYSAHSVFMTVCNHYKLNGLQRTVLYCGVADSVSLLSRVARRRDILPGSKLFIDGTNVLLTVAHYLAGRVVYIACDGWLRDAGSVYPNLPPAKTLLTGAGLIIDFLEQVKTDYRILLDNKHPTTSLFVDYFKTRIPDSGYKSLKKTDAWLLAVTGAMVATSDSGILDKAKGDITDLAFRVIHDRFMPELPDLRRFAKYGGNEVSE